MGKICKKCLVEKDIDSFYVRSCMRDGRRSECIECTKKAVSENTKKNPIKKADYGKKYSAENNEKILLYHKEYYENNKEKSKVYRDNNKDGIKSTWTNFYNKNKSSLSNKHNAYEKARCKTDPLFKCSKSVRSTICSCFRDGRFTKSEKTVSILGCSFEEFKAYLESKFEPWMNWDNKGLYNGELNYGWDIDHIIPIVTAINQEDIIRLNHYTNLQPLCGFTNRHIKRDLLDYITTKN